MCAGLTYAYFNYVLVNNKYIVLIPKLVSKDCLFFDQLTKISSFRKMSRVIALILRAVRVMYLTNLLSLQGLCI